MVKLNKDKKNGQSSVSMEFLWIVIVILVFFAGMAALGFTGYSSESKRMSELTSKINTAYENDYSIFIDGVEVQSVPDDVLENYSSYDFLSDDVGGNLLIKKKVYYNDRSITYVIP